MQPTGKARPNRLSFTALEGVPFVQKGDDMLSLLSGALAVSGEALRDGDVLVIAQKIVSKSEGRQLRLADVQPSPRAIELAAATDKDPRIVELVLSESDEVVRQAKGVLIVQHKLGFVMANAGIDQSNIEDGNDTALLLPLDPDASCRRLRDAIQERFGVAVGVIVNDSHGRAFRNGVVGVAIGVAGLPALLNLRGKPDLFGRLLQITEVAWADELASAASLMMGQAGDGLPIVLCRGLRAPPITGGSHDLVRPRKLDLFR